MERVIVVFDIYNPEIDTSSRLVKLWNSDDAASAYVNNYINKRSDLHWKYTDGDELKGWAPGSIIELHGYADEHVKDIITVYHVEAEDPDEDPMKRILRTAIPMFEKSAEEASESEDEEAPFLKYTAECFQTMLDDINKIEQKNLEKKE